MSSLVFDGIRHKPNPVPGRLRVTSEGLEWAADGDDSAEGAVRVAAGDVQSMVWTNVYGGMSQLKCTQADGGGTARFTGSWDQEAFTKLEYFIKDNYPVGLQKAKLATKGWNWGAPVFEGRSMAFEVDGKEAFDVPLKEVVNVQENKHEVTLQFNMEDTAAGAQDEEQLVEMRFLVPPTQVTDADDDSELTPAQKFLADVRDRASMSTLAADGAGIVKFEQVNFVTPRCAAPRPARRASFHRPP